MSNSLHAHYLKTMGIEVWQSRARPRPPAPESGQMEADAAPERPPAETSSSPAHANPAPIEQAAASAPATPTPQVTALMGENTGRLDWDSLRREVEGCRACPLHETRHNTVFGVGNPQADLLIVGEAPGAEEDRQGEPFVGRAGKLLDMMLAAIGLDRSRVFIANTLKCRPPANRDPQVEESMRCRPYLLRQIELIQPRLILAIGRVAAHGLLERDDSLARLRDRRHSFGPQRIPLIVSYHPAYLLRSPDQKGKAWLDLQEVAKELKRGQG